MNTLAFRRTAPALATRVALVLLASGCAAQDAVERSAPQSEGPTLACMIVDGRTDEPIPGAEVRWFATKRSEASDDDTVELGEKLEGFGLQDPASLDARAAHPTRSDAQGTIRIPAQPDGTVVVVARAGSRWGRAIAASSVGELRVPLFTDADLMVHVRDADGRPAAEVPIVIQYGSSRAEERGLPELRGISDERGIARLAHARAVLAELELAEEQQPDAERARRSITTELCALARPWLALDPRAPWPERVELRLPPCGEVEVVVRDTEGRPARLEFEPALWLAADVPEHVETGPTDAWFGGPGPRARAAARDGRVLFRHVGLGAQLAVVLRPNSASVAWVERLEGPRTPGERVAVTVTLGATHPMYVGRLVDASHRPLAQRRVVADLFSPNTEERGVSSGAFNDSAWLRTATRHLSTDADGRFSLSYGNVSESDGERVLVLTLDRNRAECTAAKLELARTSGPGLHELGDVVLSPPPIVVSGKVVDSEGGPIKGASVGLREFEGRPRAVAITDANGQFALRSADPHERSDKVWLSIDAPGYATPWREVRVGSENQWITLSRAAGIVGRLAPADGVRAEDFSLILDRGGETDMVGTVWGTIDADGAFDFYGLEPGLYSVRLKNREAGETVYQSAALELRPGETKRLEPIDLAELRRARRVRVVGPDDVPVEAGEFLVLDPSANSPDAIWTSAKVRRFERGELLVLSEYPRVDLAIAVEGCRLGWFRDVAPGSELRLERGLPVRVELARPLALRSGERLRVGLIAPPSAGRRKAGNRVVFRSTPFDELGRAELLAPGPGEYLLRWIVESGVSASSGREDPTQRATIRDQSEPQTLTLEPRFEPASR